MAKTSFQLVPPEILGTYKKALSSSDRFSVPSIRRKVSFLSRNTKKGLTQKSLFVELAPIWESFTPELRDAWESAGLINKTSGFKLFVQDTAKRRANDIEGYATPSDLHASEIGLMRLEAPSSHLKILQIHPNEYWVSRKVKGTRNQYEPKFIHEGLSFPFSLGVSYKTSLSVVGPNPRARMYAVFNTSYQGRTLEEKLEISFDFVSDWQRATGSIVKTFGLARSYTVFFELYDVRGDLFFDNVEILHSGFNWARDPFCNDIDQAFTKAFYQVPKHWAAEDLTNGAWFGSVYI